MIAGIAWHELRQQVSGRVFWIVFAVSVLMVAGAMAIDDLRVGLVEDGARTGTTAILRTHLVWTLFFMFTAAAFVGEAVLRDELNGFADLVRATPVSPRRYAIGRFLGSFGAVLLCFCSVPVAMALAGAVLGLGTGSAGSYLFACLVLALPNLLLTSALFFTLAGLTRSMSGCLLGAAALLTLYGLASDGVSGVVEPFAFAAVATATAGWDAAQRDVTLPPLSGVLLANRIVWLGFGFALAGLGTWLAQRDMRRSGRTRSWPMITRDEHARLTGKTLNTAPSHRHSKWHAIGVQLFVRSSFEARRTILTPVFAALLAMGLAGAASTVAQVAGTSAAIVALTTSFQLVPVTVVLFFAGELYWAEHEHNVASIIMATPASEAVLVLSKLLALALVLFSLAAISAAAGMIAELVKGGSPSPTLYLAWYVLPRFYDWVLVAALAVFLQSLAPNKLAGWGYMVFYLIGSLALNKLGWHDPHYRYGTYPGAPLPPALSGAHDVGWYRLGWGSIAVAMIAVACRRGLPRARSTSSRLVLRQTDEKHRRQSAQQLA